MLISLKQSDNSTGNTLGDTEAGENTSPSDPEINSGTSPLINSTGGQENDGQVEGATVVTGDANTSGAILVDANSNLAISFRKVICQTK